MVRSTGYAARHQHTSQKKERNQMKTQDSVRNPIPRSDWWADKTLAEIQEYIDQFPPRQRAELNHVFMYTLNACNRLVKTEILDRETFAD
jgi:hypothetical protein